MNATVKEEPSASSSPQDVLYDVLENGVKMETFEFDDSDDDELYDGDEEFLPPPQRTSTKNSTVGHGEPCRGRVAMCNGYQMRSIYATKKGIYWECRRGRTANLRCYGSAKSDLDGRNLVERHAHNHPPVPFNYREAPKSSDERPSRSSFAAAELLAPARSAQDNSAIRRERTNAATASSASLSESIASVVDTPYGALSAKYVVDSLVLYNKCTEVEFSRKAIESLVRKLKDKRAEMSVLVDVVRSGGRYAGTCVTIDRTLDGRLQIAERKVFPHAVYVQIFRWPDVSRVDLRSISLCNGGFDANYKTVCVNPYHYERLQWTSRGVLQWKGDDETAKDLIVLDD